MALTTQLLSTPAAAGALLAVTTNADPYEGTTYRHLTNVEDAAGVARFYAAADGIGYDPAEALRQVDAALAALAAARALLAAEVTA